MKILYYDGHEDVDANEKYGSNRYAVDEKVSINFVLYMINLKENFLLEVIQLKMIFAKLSVLLHQ